MCVGMKLTPMSEDDSDEPVKSDYEVSEEDKRNNAGILAQSNRPKSLINKNNDFDPTIEKMKTKMDTKLVLKQMLGKRK